MTLLAQLLADPYAQRQILANITAYNGSTTVTLRYSESGYNSTPTESVPNEYWAPRIVETPTIQRSMFTPQEIGGRTESDYGSLVLANASSSTDTLDALRTYAFDGRAVELRLVGILSNGTVVGYDDGGVVFSGTCAGDAVISETDVILRLRGYDWLYEKPIQNNLYRGMSHCLAFDGTNDYATLSTHTSQDACTFECWIRCDGDNTAVDTQIFAEHATAHAAATVDWYGQISTAGVLSLIAHRTQAGPTSVSVTGDVRDGKFHHLALSLQSGANGMKLYWDGALASQGTAPTFAALAAATLSIGSIMSGASNFFNGRIDEVRFWKSALTQAEIQAAMNSEIPTPVAASMFGYWQLNDNTGTTPSDSSGNAKTGALGAAGAAPAWSSSLSGYADIAGLPKPLVFGAVSNVEPVLIDPNRLIYQYHDGNGGNPAPALRTVYDSGVSIATYTSDLTRGQFTLTANPAGRITCDVDGEATFGAGLRLDGASGYVATAATANAGSMTLESLVRPMGTNSPNGGALQNWRNGVAAGLRLLWLEPGNFPELVVRNDAATLFTATSATAIPVGTWAHVAGVLDTSANFIYLYVDGVLKASTAISGAWTTTLTNLKIGRLSDSATVFLLADIDETRIWSTARTQAQIIANCCCELVGTETGLTQYWKNSETSGTNAANSVSGGAAGTLTGAASRVASRQSAWDIARRIASSRSTITTFDTTALCTANRTNSAPCGLYAREEMTLGDAIDYVVSGVGGYHYFSRSGSYTVGVFTAPAAGGTAYTTLEILEGMEQVALDPPKYRVLISYDHNWTVLDPNEVAGILTTAAGQARYGFVTKEWRYASKLSTAVQTAYAGADTLTRDGSLYAKADADVEATRVLALYGTHRELWRVPLFAQPYSLDVGQSINLTRDRFGLDSGRDFVIVAFTEGPEGIEVTVWG